MKTCPFCSESIQDTAIKCRFCGEFLHKWTDSAHKKKTESNSPFKKLWKLIENEQAYETELDTSSIDVLFMNLFKQIFCLNPKRLGVWAFWT